MYPNRGAENYCCTGGGGAMSKAEYTPRRLKSGKVKAEQLVLERTRAAGLPMVIVRPGMGWGPRDRVMFAAMVSAMQLPFFFMVGNGRNTLDLSYAGNVAHALWLAGRAARADRPGMISLSREKYCSVWHSLRQDIELTTHVSIAGSDPGPTP